MLNLKDARANRLYRVLHSGETEQHETLKSYSKTSGIIVFIDSGVDDYQSLVNGAVPEAEVIVLDSAQDGVEQITKVLQGLTEIAAIHLVSHGSPGCLYLGNSQLSLDTLNHYAAQLKTWIPSTSLTKEDKYASIPILLYGCNVAAGDAGEEFVERLGQLTGANIAASAKRTGSVALGGDWELECCTGQIDTSSAFLPELMQAYSGVFALSFKAAANFGAGDSPNSIAEGDFDGDGDVDLVIANFDSNNVSVLLNDGTGNFGSAINFAVTGSASSVAVGDFNEDGDLDLAVANYDLKSNVPDTVSVLLGKKGGSFSSATDFKTGGNVAQSVAVADFNGDGNQDLVVGSFASPGTVSILSGNGKGGFSSPSQFTTGVSAFSLVVGDFNNDNRPDIIAGGGGDGGLALLLNDGAGNFCSTQDIFTDIFFPRAGAVKDLNGDGNLDIVVGSNSGIEDEIAVLLGNGDGSFNSPIPFTTGRGSRVAVGDFNADGNLDIAAASIIDDNVSLLLGNGNGGFVKDSQINVGSNPTSIVVGDFNGDGKPDIATANSGSNNVSVLLNTTSFSSLTVDTLVDESDGDLSPGDVSLREALALISEGGTINFDPSLAGGSIDLTLGELIIDKDLTINGLGAEKLTISGNNTSRVFNIDDGDSANFIDVKIEGLTITDGLSNGSGGGILNTENLTLIDSNITENKARVFGGGIYNDRGTLEVTDTTINNNYAYEGFGGGISSFIGTLTVANSTISSNKAKYNGGGILSRGRLYIEKSTISGNTAEIGSGGGIFGTNFMSIANVTISGNQAKGEKSDAGGVYFFQEDGGTLIVNSSTITQNTTNRRGGGVFIDGANDKLIEFNNTIIAQNFDNDSSDGNSPDVWGEFSSNNRFNRSNLIGDIGDNTSSTDFLTTQGNKVGTSANPINAMLGPLQDNGGPTFTHAPLPGSPVLDAASPFGGVRVDQRGIRRPQGSGFDIGAVEGSLNPSSVGTKKGDRIVGTSANDQINSGAGNDVVFGGLGNDTLRGGSGDDFLKGEDGNDQLVGQSGKDFLFGGNGDDILWGEAKDDFLDGGDGNDRLFGQADNDTLLGGRGRDLLEGGKSSDNMTGGEGADIFQISQEDLQGGVFVDRILDFNAAEGDRLRLVDLDMNDVASVTASGISDLVLRFNSGDIVIFEGVTDASFLTTNVDFDATRLGSTSPLPT